MSKLKRTPTPEKDIWLYSSGTYYYRSGNKELSLKTTDFKEALRRKKNILSKKVDVLSGSSRLKIKDLTEDYLTTRRKEFASGEIRQSTMLHAEKYIQNIVDLFGNESISKFDSTTWEDKKHKVVGNHIVNIRSVLGHFMKWSVKRGYRTTLPILDVGRIKRRKRRVLELIEIEAIWRNTSGSLRVFVALALLMGMRRSEIMTLEWPQISFERKALFLPDSKTKTKRDRWVTIPDFVLNILSERLSQVGKSKWVFPHLTKKNTHADKDGLKSAWRTCLKKAFSVDAGEAIPNITWHDLRATCEAYAHRRTDVSATQLEKFFGASVDVQRKIYVQGDAEYVRGVEDSVLIQAVSEKSLVSGKHRGNE